MTTVVSSHVTAAADTLARHQARVDQLVARAEAGARRQVRLSSGDRARLARLGHFPAHAAELDWTPRGVAGHLRDSALVFTERIHRIRSESEPLLADFVPDEPERVAGYRDVPPVQLA